GRGLVRRASSWPGVTRPASASRVRTHFPGAVQQVRTPAQFPINILIRWKGLKDGKRSKRGASRQQRPDRSGNGEVPGSIRGERTEKPRLVAGGPGYLGSSPQFQS